jgi:hypothetical protein
MNFTVFGIPVHFCPAEAFMLVTAWGMVVGLWAWIRNKFKKHEKAEAEAHHDCCVHGARPEGLKDCGRCDE